MSRVVSASLLLLLALLQLSWRSNAQTTETFVALDTEFPGVAQINSFERLACADLPASDAGVNPDSRTFSLFPITSSGTLDRTSSLGTITLSNFELVPPSEGTLGLAFLRILDGRVTTASIELLVTEEEFVSSSSTASLEAATHEVNWFGFFLPNFPSAAVDWDATASSISFNSPSQFNLGLRFVANSVTNSAQNLYTSVLTGFKITSVTIQSENEFSLGNICVGLSGPEGVNLGNSIVTGGAHSGLKVSLASILVLSLVAFTLL